MTSKNNKEKVKGKSHSQDSVPSFIRKTYDILEERKFPDIIDWNPEGTALVIKKPPEFCQKVLPTYFKHNNLTSFVRQLNMYNFHKRRTQNIDHVYYHELFQKGKKHLLKEIKRKNHDHLSEKNHKTGDILEPSQNGKDLSSLAYENQLLKRLYNETMSKITMLESQVNELNKQNQSLWSQVCQQNGLRENSPEFIKEQFSSNYSDVSIPPLKLETENQGSIQTAYPFIKVSSASNSSDCMMKLKEEAGESTTEHSYNSPNPQIVIDSEKYFNSYENSHPYILATSQAQIAKLPSGVSQVFGTWDANIANTEALFFAEQKLNKPFTKFQQINQEFSVLGKRPLNFEHLNGEVKFSEFETVTKHYELCMFNKKGIISTGIEDGDVLYKRDGFGDEEYDPNIGVDLMDFN